MTEEGRIVLSLWCLSGILYTGLIFYEKKDRGRIDKMEHVLGTLLDVSFVSSVVMTLIWAFKGL